MINKAIFCARKFTQIYLLFGFLLKTYHAHTKPSVCLVKLNYENKNEPDSLGIYFLIVMFVNFVQDLLI